jgi:hypothetical protein
MSRTTIQSRGVARFPMRTPRTRVSDARRSLRHHAVHDLGGDAVEEEVAAAA